MTCRLRDARVRGLPKKEVDKFLKKGLKLNSMVTVPANSLPKKGGRSHKQTEKTTSRKIVAGGES